MDSVGGSDRNVLIEDHYGTVNGKDYIYFDRIVTTFNMSTEGMSTSGLKSFDGLWSSYHHPDYNLPEYASWWWYRFTIYQQSYSDYAKIFTYTKTTDQSKESTKKPSGDGVINVQRWVKYSF